MVVPERLVVVSSAAASAPRSSSPCKTAARQLCPMVLLSLCLALSLSLDGTVTSCCVYPLSHAAAHWRCHRVATPPRPQPQHEKASRRSRRRRAATRKALRQSAAVAFLRTPVTTHCRLILILLINDRCCLCALMYSNVTGSSFVRTINQCSQP